MLDRLKTFVAGRKAQRGWQTTEIAGYRVHAKVMGDSLRKVEIYDGDELVYHKSRSDVPVQKIPTAIVDRIIARLLENRR